jgi:CheY-like chemotaxis protein
LCLCRSQILSNLLGNAAKFTHQGSIRVSAKWHDEQRQWVVIQVTDTGIGIPKQKLQSIFLPFEQVDGSISRQYGGFGLGLSITQELVKAHGGELWVSSRTHKGSQFAFTIPSYTGQKPLTPQQQQQLQLQSRRSTPLARSAAAVDAVRRRSSSRALMAPMSPPAAAAAAAEQSSCNGITAAADRRPASALNADASAAVAGSAGSKGVGSPATVAPSALTADLLDSCVGDEYATELPYDAAQLSALASSKPYSSNPTASSSGSGSLQRVGSRALHHASSMLSLSAAVDGDGLDITPVPNRDQRPSQFACTGRYQVLSVDDDPINQTVVQSLLASTGYEVVCLYNGQQTLEYIENADVLPDLILLDMLMPDMSG